eukprot:60830-Rhodomonas_salina.1
MVHLRYRPHTHLHQGIQRLHRPSTGPGTALGPTENETPKTPGSPYLLGRKPGDPRTTRQTYVALLPPAVL